MADDILRRLIQRRSPNDFGLRKDGTRKGKGFLGALKRPGGGVSSELSIGVNLDGRDIEIPSLVPGLSQQQIQALLSGGQISPEVVNIAVQNARKRIAQGLSPFFD